MGTGGDKGLADVHLAAIEDFRLQISEKLRISETQELGGQGASGHAPGANWRFQIPDFREVADFRDARTGGTRG